ncbi:MAG: LPS assembly lipoprotein LptE [Bacteroidales bacterium]|nr:LPS assembly lipoprotein LptE [Bacteroidales bacterium]
MGLTFNRRNAFSEREGQITDNSRKLSDSTVMVSNSIANRAGSLISRSAFTILLAFLMTAMATLLVPGCTVKYGFSGASLSPEVKSISIQYFQNMAPLVQPGLSQYLTDEFTDKVRSQTNKEMVRDLGDVNFEGEIVDYRTAPQAVSGNATASVNRFTISVRVRYTNSIDPDFSFEQTFTRFEDYDSALELSSVEQDLMEKIVKQLIEDIFNRAFVNW